MKTSTLKKALASTALAAAAVTMSACVPAATPAKPVPQVDVNRVITPPAPAPALQTAPKPAPVPAPKPAPNPNMADTKISCEMKWVEENGKKVRVIYCISDHHS